MPTVSAFYMYKGYAIWASTYPTNLNLLILLQKKVIRVLGNEDFYAHSSPIFKSLKILATSYVKLIIHMYVFYFCTYSVIFCLRFL